MKKLYILIFISSITSTAFAQVPTEAWASFFGDSQADVIEATCTDNGGNYYVAGSFNGTVDFDPSGGVQQRTTASSGATDAFIAKFNPVGVLSWVVTFGGVDDDAVYGITADDNGVYVTGYFGSTVDFDPVGVLSKTSAGSTDIFVAKYNPTNGSLMFVNTFGDVDGDYGTAITVNNGSLYVTGGFSGDVDFDPSNSSSDFEVSWGDVDVFLAKYSTLGSYGWAIDVGSTTADEGRAVVTDGSSVWVGGLFSETFYPDPNDYSVTGDPVGLNDGFISQYDVADGSWQAWGTIQSSDDDVVTSLALDGNGGLYVAGEFSGSATMYGASSTNKSLSSKGGLDNFVGRYEIATRKLLWVNGFGSTVDDYVTGIVADPGSVYVVGAHGGSMDVDPSGNTVNVAFGGNTDAYMVKYNYNTGAYVTSFAIGGTGYDQARSIAIGQGYLYFSGVFTGTADLDPGVINNSKASISGSFDCFLTRFDPVEPLLSTTSVAASNVGATTATLTFTGNGLPDGYITLYNTGSAVTAVPVDGLRYNPGDAPGGNGKVLVTSPSTTLSVTGLLPSTTYFMSVFPYNGTVSTTGNINYKTTTPGTTSFTTGALATEPALNPTLFTTSALTSTSYTVSYTAPVVAPAGYIALRTTGPSTTPNTDPVDGVPYSLGSSLGNATVAYVGSSTTFNESGLAFSTIYNYKVYAYNGNNGGINYRQTSPLPGNATTTGAAEPTLQPTNLQFTQITATSFNYSFTASTGSNVGGYVGIRRTGAAPTFVPTDGVELTVGDLNGDGSYVAFAGTGTGYGLTGATSNTDYYYAIYAYNGTGTNINYLLTNPLTGHTTTLDTSSDTTKPTINDNTAGTVGASDGLNIVAVVTDNGSGVDYVYVEFYPINSADYGNEYMDLQSGGTYTYPIGKAYNTEQGIEYKIHAVDLAGNEAETPWTSVVRTYPGDGLQIPYSAGSDQTNYRIISVPLDLQKKQVNDVFDELGNYDKTKYRLFHYTAGNVNELSGTASIDLGKGYWFIAGQQTSVFTGPGKTAVTGIDKDISIPVIAGWNQIGNPYNFDVTWSNVIAANSDKTLAAFKKYEGSFSNALLLRTMSGGFVMVTTAGDNKLLIPVNKDARIAAPAPPVNFAQTIDSDTWGVDLVVRSGEMENNFAGIGMRPDANEQSDKYDDYTLPRFMDYLELNHNKKIFGSPFTKDIVPTSTQHIWEFQVASNLNSEVVELSWDNSYFGNNDLQLILWDVSQQRAVNMKSEKTYSFERRLSGTFKIFYGSESFVNKEIVPNAAVFHSASPVPSSGNVTFAYSVPESNGDVKTNLTIYNSLGQKVSKLVDQALPAGYHQTVWIIEDGAKPAAGVYISVLKFGEATLQKRLIIK
jgi:hypothetical protein